MNNAIFKYRNGTVDVSVYRDGTKIRKWDSEEGHHIEFPESIDCNITRRCDLGCPFCHEECLPNGEHGDLKRLEGVLSDLPAGIELAIGVNDMSHPELPEFLQWCYDCGYLASITINQVHLGRNLKQVKDLILKKLVHGVGVSISNRNDLSAIRELHRVTDNIVCHVIAGVHSPMVLNDLIASGLRKILVLGYKDFGRGAIYHNDEVDSCLKSWNKHLPPFLGQATISFDNLALEQISVKEMIGEKEWNERYMGDDFSTSMYVDAVLGLYAPTSRSPYEERVPFSEMPLLDYFKLNHSEI